MTADMRRLMNLVEGVVDEALSKHATVPPATMQGRAATPVGEVLFHGTPLDHLINILKANALFTGADWRGEGERVSLSRSYKVAVGFGEQGDMAEYPSVLVLDWKRLAAAYPVIPHNDVDAEGNHWKNSNSEDGTEQEEAVYGVVRPLNRFLISVNVSPKLVQQAMTDAGFIEWCIEEKGWAKTRRGVVTLLQAVLNHPKLNVWHPAA